MRSSESRREHRNPAFEGDHAHVTRFDCEKLKRTGKRALPHGDLRRVCCETKWPALVAERNRQLYAEFRLLPATMCEHLDSHSKNEVERQHSYTAAWCCAERRSNCIVKDLSCLFSDEGSTPILGSFGRPCGIGSTRLHESEGENPENRERKSLRLAPAGSSG